MLVGFISLSIIMTMIVLNMHHRANFQAYMPKAVETVILKWMATAVFLSKTVENNRAKVRKILINL